MNKRKVVVKLHANEKSVRFIEACKSAGIKVMKVFVEKERLYFTVYYEDVKKLRKIRKKFRIRLSLQYDSSYVLQPQLKVIVGLALFLLVPILAQRYVWQIEVQAPTPEQRLKAEQALEGIQLPLQKAQYTKIQKTAEQLVKTVPHIAWAHVISEGSVVTITLQPAPITEVRKEQKNETIIATKNGVIERYFVTQGEIQVKQGDTVTAGDVLVEDLLLKQAQAKVFANYWLTIKFKMPVKITYYTAEEDEQTLVKHEIKLDETHIDSHILPLVERKILAQLPLETTLQLQKLLHVTYDSDTVMGEALYLVNENIAAPSSR